MSKTTITDIPKYVRHRGAIKSLNPEFVALWESYLDEGLSAKHVAEIFGVHADTVRKYYPGRVWTVPQKLEYGLAIRNFNMKMRKVRYT